MKSCKVRKLEKIKKKLFQENEILYDKWENAMIYGESAYTYALQERQKIIYHQLDRLDRMIVKDIMK